MTLLKANTLVSIMYTVGYLNGSGGDIKKTVFNGILFFVVNLTLCTFITLLIKLIRKHLA
jgi:hypothetical protein